MRFLPVALGLFFLLSVASASNASIVYRSNSGSCGINCPKWVEWSNVSGGLTSEVELGTSTGGAIREARVYFSPLNQKRIVVTENDNGELDLYVSWDGSAWTQTRNLTDLWVSAPTTHYRGFDLAFEQTTGNALLVFSVVDTSTTCDLGYYRILAGATAVNTVNYSCIDDGSANGGSDLQYGWMDMDANISSGSNQLAVAGEDQTGNDASAWIWNGSAWGNQQEITAAATVTGDFEALGVQYGANGSRAVAVAATGTAGVINYQAWNGSTWTATASLGDVSSGNDDVQWITMAADPATGNIMVIEITSDGGMSSSYWNGASWSNTVDVATATDASSTRAASFAWNLSGSTGQLVFDNDTTGSALSNRTFSGGSWLTPTSTFTNFGASGAWLQMAGNPSPGEAVRILGVRLNSLFDISVFNFTTSAYAPVANLTTDTTVTTFEAMHAAFVRNMDAAAPTIANTSANSTIIGTGFSLCINATAYDSASLGQVRTQVTFPNGTITNFTMSDNGCNAITDNDNWFGVSIDVGSATGTLTVNTTFANDSFGNMGSQSPYPQLNVTVTSTFYVNGSNACYTPPQINYPTIQQAIDAASNGLTIVVCPNGTNRYTENVVVNKSLNLNGYNESVVVNASNSSLAVFNLTPSSSYINITNFSVRDSVSGFRLDSSTNNILANNTANQTTVAFRLLSSSSNTLAGNSIYSSTLDGIRLQTSNLNNLIVGNKIYNSRTGFEIISSSHNNILANNSVYNTSSAGYGFYLDTSNGLNLTNNTANSSNSYGFFLTVCSGANLTSNIAYNTSGSPGTGFYLTSTSTSTLASNTAYNSTQDGFFLTGSSTNNLTGNRAYNNSGSGLNFTSTSNSNNLTNNSAYNNTYGISLLGTSNSNILTNNSAYSNSQYGFYLNGSSTSNKLTNNSASSNVLYGFYIASGSGNTLLTNNSASANLQQGFSFDAVNGINLTNNTASSNSLVQYNFNNSNATFLGVNQALLTGAAAFDINMSNRTNITTLSGGVFNSIVTDYLRFFFDNGSNVSIQAMGLASSGASVSGCTNSSYASCTLLSNSSNVLNITNLSSTAFAIGLYYNNTLGKTNVYVGRFNLSSSGYDNLGRSANNLSAATVSFGPLAFFGTFSPVSFDLAPVVANTSINTTATIGTSTPLCINATAYDPDDGNISIALAQVTFPNGTITNFTMSDTGCNAGGNGDTWYGVSIIGGPSGGTLRINTTFANDTFATMGSQSPYPQLNITVDATGPTVANTSVNSTSPSSNDFICINATAYDGGTISQVWTQVTFPNGTITNFTMSDTGCNAGVGGDTWFGVSVDVGGSAGTLVVNTTFANDSFSNLGSQSPYPQLNVTPGSFVDTSISSSTLAFGNLDPATSNNAATENPISLTNTANSNAVVDIYLNNSNMTSGSNFIPYYNLSVHTANSAAASTNFNYTTWLNSSNANTGFIEDLAIDSSVNLYFWHDVPAAQTAGSYTATVLVHSVAGGQAP